MLDSKKFDNKAKTPIREDFSHSPEGIFEGLWWSQVLILYLMDPGKSEDWGGGEEESTGGKVVSLGDILGQPSKMLGWGWQWESI